MKHVNRIGISGWTYVPWRKVFYPEDLPQRLELNFASRQVNSIEVNGAFYSLQRPESFLKWFAEVPDDFIFSVKANRFITHIKKLNQVEEPLANFFASGILALEHKLGPVLWQFPPAMKFDPARFETFLKLLPIDQKTATRLAKKHGAMVKGRSYFPPAKSKNYKIRHAVEVRHDSFASRDFVKLLKKYNVALVTADSAGKFPYFEEATADFAYVRLHGAVELYASGYTEPALKKWAQKIKSWSKTRDVYVYFDNDIKVQAPYNAVQLLKMLIKNYEPAVPMKSATFKDLKLPGPRLGGPDTRWRKREKK